MGVKGLWSLLNPVSRPVQIESLEGKRMAIDSSIWLYQFQATMRDKDGRVLVNAHVLGFLRRINKLLFHGIKPVFVFDGGAPVLKRNTIAERKRKKAGAAANHARMAEKLFAAQMRREAVKVAQAAREQGAARQEAEAAATAARYYEDEGEQIAEGAIYLDELEGQAGPSRQRVEPTTTTTAPTVKRTLTPPPDPREERRKKFRKMDPYRLPEASMPTVSTGDKPDARLATEAELKQFIDEVHPEDIDIESPEFRALPTEVQYEIVGDMRVRSRQTSHKRLADMLRAAPSALDFSMAQIKNLSQRNALTQQLLTVTDMVGQAHLTIPVRIAAERNREYVLVKRDETQGGGWALGIREGSKQKPIEVEKDEKAGREVDSDSDYSESDVEEIAPPPQVSRQTTDPDLKEHRRREVLEAIAARYAPKKAPRASLDIEPKSFGKARLPGAMPLFELTEEEDDENEVVPSANDEALALALQQEELGSDEEEADLDLARALALSRKGAEGVEREGSVDSIKSATSEDSFEEVSLDPSRVPTPQVLSQQPTPIEIDIGDEDEDFDMIEVGGPLAPSTFPTAKAVQPPIHSLSDPPITAPAIPSKPLKASESVSIPIPPTREAVYEQGHHVVSSPTDLTEVDRKLAAEISKPDRSSARLEITAHPNASNSITVEDVEDDYIEILPESSKTAKPAQPEAIQEPRFEVGQRDRSQATTGPREQRSAPMTAGSSNKPVRDVAVPSKSVRSDSTTGASAPASRPPLPRSLSRLSHRASPAVSRASSARSVSRTPAPEAEPDDPDNLTNSLLGIRATRPVDRHSYMEMAEESVPSSYQGSAYEGENGAKSDSDNGEDEEDEDAIEWSKSPSPTRVSRPPLQPAQSGETIPSEVEDEDENMAPSEMVAEQDDYARFMASIRNRDLNEVRTEIDDEIRVLNSQNKVAMRDSDEITQAMVAQIQTLLRHYGIPYITAPMEAEAQCAKLAELGLVDGIITDDSDVFLFGGVQCFKNIFNDAKYAECFLSSDVERELALSRERLISLAYLLGSDYTIGLPGVGPVVALELLSEFPGPNGIENFKSWWTLVQRGQDTASETNTKWKTSFRKRFAATILLTADWPNHLVREAYRYPTTDESEEPFHWGFPKLSALRSFLHEELSWSISKVDDELTPIVQRIARRGKVGQLNKQATLDPFFDLSAGSGNYAPRRRTTANVSKRLLAVIKAFREAEARVVGGFDPDWELMMKDLDAEDPKGKGTGKRRKSESVIGEGGAEIGTEVDGGGDQVAEKPKPRKPRKKKSESEIGDAAPSKKGRPRTNTASSASISEIGKESVPPHEPSTSAEILIPKTGLRGSATGVVGSGKRKKAALKAWRSSTQSKDLGPS